MHAASTAPMHSRAAETQGWLLPTPSARPLCRVLLHLRPLATCRFPSNGSPVTSERSVCEFSHWIGSCRPLDFCLYGRYKYESKRSGVQIFFAFARPADGLLVEQDQGSRPTSHAVSAKSRKNRRRSRPFEAVDRKRPPAILSTLRAHRV